ncbi:mitochondrial ribonuclease P protein 1 homolog [Planococcus citri]|uniref:mitochondrial ribonuclease P protein 1 homolog n=1 Tax=Planococcus citri TaxID=170843 RepID=UPI0031F7E6F0
MILACPCVLLRISTSVLKKYTREFSHSFSSIKYPFATSQIQRRYFSEKQEDFYAAINTEDFEIYEQKSGYKEADLEKIAEGDEEKIKILKRIQLEIDVRVQEGHNIPNEISSTEWINLLSLPTKSQRFKRLDHLWKNENRKLLKKQKQALYRKQLINHKSTDEPRQPLTTSSPVEYGLLKTTLFHRFYEPDMKNLYNFRLLQAEMFGPHLIIDCGFEEFMGPIDLSACVRDILYSWSRNRDNFDPFDLHFCNLDKNSKLFSKLCGVLPALVRDPACPFNHTDKHYLDFYPKEKLVYLTPHSREEMKSFESDSIYIIGGLNDRSKDMALTLAKAKQEGIRKQKFPLDKYLKWNIGKKTLSITECVDIMNDLKDGKSWNFALRRLRDKQTNPPATTSRLSRDETDDEEDETNKRTAEHIERLIRLKDVYDGLLKNRK